MPLRRTWYRISQTLAKVTREAIDRMHKKIDIARDEITHVEEYCMEDAEYAVVAFGGTARTAYEAVLAAREKGIKVGMVRLVTIWPFADKAIKALAAKVKGILVAELNYGQIVGEVERAAAGQCPVELCAKYDMTIFEPEEILEGIEDLVAGGNK